ncbi:MAG: DUF1574 domain-containing protein [Spirochaetota bacterium]
MIRRKYLLYPVVLFIILFLVDKIFLLEDLKPYIKSDFTYIYYQAKEDLFERLRKKYAVSNSNKRNKKLMIILGSSRLLYFDAQELRDYYPHWDIYNFSSAVTTPAYYYYYLEKIYKAGIQPDLVLLESDPNQFNQNAPAFKKSNLTYSFDPSFIRRHAFLFGKEYVSYYLGKLLFASSKNKPYLHTAFKRFGNSNFAFVNIMRNWTKDYLLKNQGHAPSLLATFVERDFGILEATSQRTIDWLYRNYKPSQMQYQFLQYIMQDSRQKKVPLIVVWPQSSIPMQRMLKKEKYVEDWRKRVTLMAAKYRYALYDMDDTKEYYCNSFVDGGHIAKECYRPFMRFVMTRYYWDHKAEQEK